MVIPMESENRSVIRIHPVSRSGSLWISMHYVVEVSDICVYNVSVFSLNLAFLFPYKHITSRPKSMFWNVFSSQSRCPFSPGLFFIVMGRGGGKGCSFLLLKSIMCRKMEGGSSNFLVKQRKKLSNVYKYFNWTKKNYLFLLASEKLFRSFQKRNYFNKNSRFYRNFCKKFLKHRLSCVCVCVVVRV